MSDHGFTATGAGNYLRQFNGFKVSYRPGSAGVPMGLAFFSPDECSDETALIVGNEFFILNGDFRTEYTALADDGLRSCLEFFLKRGDVRSSRSAGAETALTLVAALSD